MIISLKQTDFCHGVGKKFKLCLILKANCVGNCAGLYNLAPNKIFGHPLPIKANIESFLSYFSFYHINAKFLL